MSPILVRPVREQLEHDRVIRLLPQELASRKVEVVINPGSEQNAAVGGAGKKEYPDALVYSTEKARRLIGVIEVETSESVNNLEATWQWAQLARLKVPFYLYVPMSAVDVARRLSAANNIPVAEIWSYHQLGDQMKFTLIHRDEAAAALPPGPPDRPARRPAARSAPAAAKTAKRAAATTKRTAGGRTAKAAARNGSAARRVSKTDKSARPTRRPAAAAKSAKKTASKAAPRRAAAKPAARRTAKNGRPVRSAKRSSK